MERVAYTYLLCCRDGTLYAGWTYDPEARLRAHNSGRAAKYTRSRLPVRLALLERHDGKISAMRREAALRRLSRTEKLALCAAWRKEWGADPGTF